ncbi:TraM recognition domain-containing protein [Spiroplasma sp. AdecLV25b]|uniref:TraM recognition domain-containing protein n=1 Tax=Spiroplasma sp. AdecLV25b TaxID=3027162 RepID=UPI0027DFC3BB|nr:TraM recognition domain-containing protein [Spiroplasma sp. AdecLV25b]
MSLFDFTEPHYQAIAHNYLLFLIKVLINKSLDITFENIVKYFPIKKVKTLLNKDDKEYDILKKFLDNEHDIKGFEHRLSIYAEQLNKSIGYENDLSILVKNHKVILFSLNSFKYPELASNMGKLLIQDLKEFATIKPQNQNINLIFDEFNLFVTDAVINLINKSRSFNYQCFLCFQEIKSLEVNKKNLTDIIFGNVSNIICQKVLDPNTAEYLAKVFGTKTSEALTHQIDYQNSNVNKGSIRAVEEYIAHPNDLKNLKIGQAYVKILLPSSNQWIDKIDIENYIDE